MNIIQNRIDAQNTLALFINEVVPALQAYLLTSGFKIKNSGQLYWKNLIAVNEIIAKHQNNNTRLRAYIDCSYGNIKLNADINYSTGDYGCQYIKEYVYLYNLKDSEAEYFNQRKTGFTVQAYEQGLQRIKILEQEISFIEDDISDVKRDIGI